MQFTVQGNYHLMVTILWAGAHFTKKLCHNPNSMEIPFCFFPDLNPLITTKFCTCHDSCAVMACAKFCSDQVTRNGLLPKQISSNWTILANIICEMGQGAKYVLTVMTDVDWFLSSFPYLLVLWPLLRDLQVWCYFWAPLGAQFNMSILSNL